MMLKRNTTNWSNYNSQTTSLLNPPKHHNHDVIRELGGRGVNQFEDFIISTLPNTPKSFIQDGEKDPSFLGHFPHLAAKFKASDTKTKPLEGTLHHRKIQLNTSLAKSQLRSKRSVSSSPLVHK